MVKRLRTMGQIEEERLRRSRCYIEELPNEILVDILSRLKTAREVAATFMVSRRWRDLATVSWCRILDLDFSEKHKPKDVRKCVDRWLSTHQGEVDHLKISFHDDYRCNWSLEKWFKFAMDKGVQSVDFDVKSCLPFTSPANGFLRYRCLPPRIAMSFDPWDTLTFLSFKSVGVEELDVPLLLTLCPNLETLLLESVPVRRLYLSNTILIPKLKRLEIQNCVAFNSVFIDSAPNLESFKHLPLRGENYSNISVTFNHTPKLVAIYLGGPLCRRLMTSIKNCAPQLLKLQLDMDVECEEKRCLQYDTIFPELENLKQLELRFTCTQGDGHDTFQMDTAIAIIHACPCLEQVTLKYEIQTAGTGGEYFCDNVDVDYDLNRGANECLKEVNVVGWSGLKSEVRFIRYLIHTSLCLQRLLLDSTPAHQTETSWRGAVGPVVKTIHELECGAQVAQQLVGYLHKLAK